MSTTLQGYAYTQGYLPLPAPIPAPSNGQMESDFDYLLKGLKDLSSAIPVPQKQYTPQEDNRFKQPSVTPVYTASSPLRPAKEVAPKTEMQAAEELMTLRGPGALPAKSWLPIAIIAGLGIYFLTKKKKGG